MSHAVTSNSYAEGTAVYADSLPTPPGSKKKDSQTEETPQFNDVLKSEVAANTQKSTAAVLKSSASTPSSPSSLIAAKSQAKGVAKTAAATIAKQAQASSLSPQQKAAIVPATTREAEDPEEAISELKDETGSDVEKESEQPQLTSNLQQSYKNLVSSNFSYSSLITSQSVLPKTVTQKGADLTSAPSKDKKASDSSSAQSSSSTSSILDPFSLHLNLPISPSPLDSKDDAKDSTADVTSQALTSLSDKSDAPVYQSPTGINEKAEISHSQVSKETLDTSTTTQGTVPEKFAPLSNEIASTPATPQSPGLTTTFAQTNASFNLQRQIHAASLPDSSTTSLATSSPQSAEVTPSAPLSSFLGSNWSSMQLSLQLKKSAVQPSTDTKSSSVEKMSPTTPTQGTIFHQNSDAISSQAANSNDSNNQNQFFSQQPHLQVTDLQSVTNALATPQKGTAPERAITALTLGTNHAIEKAVANTNLSSNANWTGTTNLAATSPMNTTSHKVLNSNSEFTGVLRQAVHQVQSDPSVSVLSPRRISIEIQTPPGAVVNVYISRQNDQFRAQLSTSDPQALKWVQDQVSALQQSPDMGSDVRWLPAQLESQQRDESWRGGNNQDQPTPDERNQKKAPESQNPEDDFMNITNKIKGAV